MLTALVMIAEILGGHWLGSMALLADGFHMSTHVGALGISLFAYAFARRHSHDPRYSFGTGKVGDLAGFTSALILLLIAFYVIIESAERLMNPVHIFYGEAVSIAVIGLVVNGVSAAIMHSRDHHHEHESEHDDHVHHHHKHDSNFRSAYLHILADAVTSLLAIGALLCGWIFGWQWMDPIVGIIGAIVIISWAISLIRDTSAVLLDRVPHSETADKVRNIIKSQKVEITDFHLWRIGPGAYAAILAITSAESLTASTVRNWLKPLGIVHTTIEINQP